MKITFPLFDIYSLTSKKLPKDSFIIDRFSPYLQNNPHVQNPHKHSFYHLVFFTKGKGEHTLDFNKYNICKGMFYVMRPNQVHHWEFENPGDGYVINFTQAFFEYLQWDISLLQQFPFFNYFGIEQVFYLSNSQQKEVTAMMEQMLEQMEAPNNYTPLSIGALLMQLFIYISKTIDEQSNKTTPANNTHINIANKFLSLIELHFNKIKLPKEYAALLHISSAHLNEICKEQLYTTAGNLIRERILLEAKRLLVNKDLNINDIALELNFLDTSYFVRFFKKYVGITPENFRKQQH